MLPPCRPPKAINAFEVAFCYDSVKVPFGNWFSCLAIFGPAMWTVMVLTASGFVTHAPRQCSARTYSVLRLFLDAAVQFCSSSFCMAPGAPSLLWRVPRVPRLRAPGIAKPSWLPLPSPISGEEWVPLKHEETRVDKLRNVHRNPVKRGSVEKSEHWTWSSYRHIRVGGTRQKSTWTPSLTETRAAELILTL